MAEESAAMNTPEETINAATKKEYQGPIWLVEKINRAETSISLNRPSSPTIYRVPDSLRELNKEAYIPQVISIGPLHHGSLKLKSMENYKLRLFRKFVERTNIDKEKLASIIQDSEESVRECYAEAIPFDPDTLKQIILVDASFLIEFFLRFWSGFEGIGDDLMELKPWRIRQIVVDLRLLENQLPFFIIEKLYELLPLESPSTYPSSFLELTLDGYFIGENVQKIRDDGIDSEEVIHLLDLKRYFYLCPRQSLPERSFKVVDKMYCASQLAEAGLKFKPISSRSIVDLKFNEGVLEIPTFTLDTETEIEVRNLVALEQCHYPLERYVTDYFIMLDFLIDTGKDVELLVDKEIIKKTRLGANIIPTLAGSFCTGISWREVNTDYYDLCRQLVEFRKKHWYVILKSSLKRDYFRTPWMGAATVGAIILLILTLIQTICTVISIFK
ncbi:hypothetical protein I3842_16G091700 [Carya illinoinensis]|uniref:Uncharacterized protein n=1 Tax=Carya illinoinensis TaxID=32201 RepID=A0A922D604_CARIL|nr:hypothetical protein I3842_16G091700 [Carya illinoinensis]KAG6673047.1 hypothetical protein I3842_16G091700 [Carya illinoinensis]KAG6673048.1 hypothetical protein I3842_16G091700 [Carya illinoinensis]